MKQYDGTMTQIRPWHMEDAEALAQSLNNPRIHANLRDGLPLPYTVADAKAYIQQTLTAPQDSQYAWAIVSDGKVVGSIGIFRQGNIHRLTAELGYFLAESHWGRGIVTRAVLEASRHVFTHTDIVRIFAEPFAHNIASCRVLEKAGFQFEGVLRQNAIKDGILQDMRLYALLRDQYLQQNEDG